jgi:hypothetical protein
LGDKARPQLTMAGKLGLEVSAVQGPMLKPRITTGLCAVTGR